MLPTLLIKMLCIKTKICIRELEFILVLIQIKVEPNGSI